MPIEYEGGNIVPVDRHDEILAADLKLNCPSHPKSREAVLNGMWNALTTDQKAAALAYRGREDCGDGGTKAIEGYGEI